MDPPSFDKTTRAAYLGWLHDRGGRSRKPEYALGWSAEETFDGEALPADPVMRQRLLTVLAVLRPDDPALGRERAA